MDGKMKISEQMRLFVGKVALVDRTWMAATAGEVMDWAEGVAELEDLIEGMASLAYDENGEYNGLFPRLEEYLSVVANDDTRDEIGAEYDARIDG